MISHCAAWEKMSAKDFKAGKCYDEGKVREENKKMTAWEKVSANS